MELCLSSVIMNTSTIEPRERDCDNPLDIHNLKLLLISKILHHEAILDQSSPFPYSLYARKLYSILAEIDISSCNATFLRIYSMLIAFKMYVSFQH